MATPADPDFQPPRWGGDDNAKVYYEEYDERARACASNPHWGSIYKFAVYKDVLFSWELRKNTRVVAPVGDAPWEFVTFQVPGEPKFVWEGWGYRAEADPFPGATWEEVKCHADWN